MKAILATTLIGFVAVVQSYPGFVNSHIGTGGLSLISSHGGGFGGSHDSYGSSLGGGGGHGISLSSLGSFGGHGSGGYGGGHFGSLSSEGHGMGGGGGGYTGGDHHGGVSIVSLGEGKGSSFDLTGGHGHGHGYGHQLFGGTIVSSGKHEGSGQAQQAVSGGDLGDEYHHLSGASHGLSGGGHEISSVLAPSDWASQGGGGHAGLSLQSHGGLSFGGGHEGLSLGGGHSGGGGSEYIIQAGGYH